MNKQTFSEKDFHRNEKKEDLYYGIGFVALFLFVGLPLMWHFVDQLAK